MTENPSDLVGKPLADAIRTIIRQELDKEPRREDPAGDGCDDAACVVTPRVIEHLQKAKSCKLRRDEWEEIPELVRELVPESRRPNYVRPGEDGSPSLEPAQVSDVLRAVELLDRKPDRRRRDWLMIAVMYCTGCRRKEMLHIKLGDVHTGSDYIQLRAETCKSAVARKVPLHPAVSAQIEEFCREITGEHHIFQGQGRPYPGGERTTPSAVYRLFQSLQKPLVEDFGWSADTAGEIGCHSFRKAIAKRVAGQEGIRAAQELLGHQQVTTTERYVDSGFDERRDAVAQAFSEVSVSQLELIA